MAKRGGKLEIFLSPRRGDIALVGGLSPSSTAFDVVAEEKNEKMGDGKKKMGGSRKRKRARCRALLE